MDAQEKSSDEVVAPQHSHVMTLEQMQARANLLVSEIDANEEENRMMQQELDALYAQIDRAKS